MRPHRLPLMVALVLCAALAALARAQVWDWDPAIPDPSLDTVPLHITTLDTMQVCIGGVRLGEWMPGGTEGDLMIRPGLYIAHAQKSGFAYVTTTMNVEASTDTLAFSFSTPPDLVGRWQGRFDGEEVTWTFSPVECATFFCADSEPPTCGIVGQATLASGPCIANAVMFFPEKGQFMMRYGPDPDGDPANVRILSGWVTESFVFEGYTESLDAFSSGDGESEKKLFVLNPAYE